MAKGRRLYDESLRQPAHCGKHGFVKDLPPETLEFDPGHCRLAQSMGICPGLQKRRGI
jgi:hypothetical protein